MLEPRFNPWIKKTPWRREWQPTPVFLPGEFHGPRSLTDSLLQSVGSQRIRHYWENLCLLSLQNMFSAKNSTLDLSQKAEKWSAKNAMIKINFSCFWCFYIKIYSYIKIAGLWVFLFSDSLYVIFFSHSQVSIVLEKLVLY